MNKWKTLALAGGIALASHSAYAEVRYPESGNGRFEKKLTHAKEYMVAAANPYATEAGLRILEKGGSAIDAAIAVQTVLNLVEPESSGIGGGGFALYWDNANKQLSTYDGREKAPMAATEKLFQNVDGSKMSWWEALAGGRAVGVPGVVAMMEKMHEKHGKLPWAELFEDAIKLSERGFEISPKLAASVAKRTNPALGRYDEAWQYFFPNGEPLKPNSIKKNPEFAKTLRRIATLGSKAFYKGDIAKDIVAAAQGAKDNPGLITEADMAAYEAVERPPVCAPYKAYKVCGMGPPTSGGLTVIQILKLLEGKKLEQYEPMSLEAAHLFTQAGRLAYADRAKYMADADFVDVPVEGLVNSDYLKKRAELITDKDMGDASAGTPPNADQNWKVAQSPEQPSTTHFSVIDKEGNGLSMTSSIEMAFGSTVMVRGFLLNNQLTDFSFLPEKDGEKVANRVEAGKRPRSSMSPFMVFNDKDELVMLIGSPGGSRIINYVAKTMIGVMDWKLDIQAAIDLPHVVNRNGSTDLEAETSAANLKEGLEAKGHKVNVRDLNSGLHGITIHVDGLQGGADPRRVGTSGGK